MGFAHKILLGLLEKNHSNKLKTPTQCNPQHPPNIRRKMPILIVKQLIQVTRVTSTAMLTGFVVLTIIVFAARNHITVVARALIQIGVAILWCTIASIARH